MFGFEWGEIRKVALSGVLKLTEANCCLGLIYCHLLLRESSAHEGGKGSSLEEVYACHVSTHIQY